jgi:hypothetical protein
MGELIPRRSGALIPKCAAGAAFYCPECAEREVGGD